MKVHKASGAFLVLILILIIIVAILFSPHLLVSWEEVDENVWEKDLVLNGQRVILVQDCQKEKCLEMIFRQCHNSDKWDMTSSTPDNDEIVGLGCYSGLSFETKDWRWWWTFYYTPQKKIWNRLPSVTLDTSDVRL